MKKFIQKTLLVISLTLLAICAIIGALIHYKPAYILTPSYDDYVIQENQYKLIQTNPDKKNVIIGDSRGNASLIPGIIGPGFINLSIPGSNFFEGYITLKKRMKVCPIDTLVIIYGLYFYEENRYFEHRTIPMKFLSDADLEHLKENESKFGYTINKPAFAGNKYKLKAFQTLRDLKYHHFPLSFIKNFSGLLASIKNNVSHYNLSNITKELGYIPIGLADSSNGIIDGEKINSSFNPNLVTLCYLDSITQFCERSNIKVIFTTPPVNESTYRVLNHSKYTKSFESFIASYPGVSKFTVIHLFNYLPNFYFGDPYHLNRKGAELYSENFRNLLYSR